MRLRLLILAIVAFLCVALFRFAPLPARRIHRRLPVDAAVIIDSSGPLRCYHLAFDPPSFLRAVPMLPNQSLPNLIVLSHALVSAPWRLASTTQSNAPAKWSMAKWAAVTNDSIDIIIPTLHWAVGARLRLPVVGDTLNGLAWPYLDVPSNQPAKAHVRAIAVHCPDMIPPSHR